MIEDEAAQQVVAFYDAILKSRDIRLVPDSMILDYGCGSGRHTYEYVDAGFRNAFGFAGPSASSSTWKTRSSATVPAAPDIWRCR